ncbi:MAG: hypothetical protein U5M53_12360 [Rhodoferax sp.]|nr:hypothetical protein [Rhodoferax sp.]
MLKSSWRARAVAGALAMTLCACSPALNWRTVGLGSLRFSLPCKPDQAQRDVPLGGTSRALEMRGCEADGALFAISRVVLDRPEEAAELVQAWRTAALAALQAAPAAVEDVAAPHHRKLPDVQAVAWLRAKGREPQGSEVQAQLGWLVVGREVFHLAVYAPHLVPSAVAPLMTDIDRPQ